MNDDAILQLYGAVLDGPPPLGRVELDLRTPGLHLLYGANGVGKSTILRALRRAFTGVGWDSSLSDSDSSHAEVHVRMHAHPDRGGLLSDGFRGQRALRRLLLENPAAQLAPSPSDDGQSYRQLAAAALLKPGLTVPNQHAALDARMLGLGAEVDDDELRDLVDAVIAQGSIILRPSGAGTFAVYLGARLDDTVPLLTGVFTEGTEQARAALEAGIPNWRIGWSSNSPITRWLRTAGVGRIIRHLDGGLAPSWEALPLVHLGQVLHGAKLVPRLISDAANDLDALTRNRLTSSAIDVVEAAVDERDFYNDALDAIHDVAKDWEELANGQFQSLLLDAPPLELWLPDPENWRTAIGMEQARWQAMDATGAIVGIDKLSAAQQRLANLAIAFSMPLETDEEWQPAIALLDEPERALHRRAEAHLVEALADHRLVGALHLVCATHSPRFLTHPKAHLLHARRADTGVCRVEAFEGLRGDLEAQAEELGVGVQDLMQLFRVVVLVEGHHDKAFLEAMLPAELEAASALVMTIGGARQLPHVLSAQLLLRLTEASVLVMVDNASEGLLQAWDAAVLAYTDGRASEAKKSLSAYRNSDRTEQRLLYEFMIRTIELEAVHRVSPFGLEHRDIINYLPPRSLGLDEESWEPLEAAFRSTGQRDFKEFLRARGARISTNSIAKAASELDYVPTEFTELSRRLLSTARSRAQLHTS